MKDWRDLKYTVTLTAKTVYLGGGYGPPEVPNGWEVAGFRPPKAGEHWLQFKEVGVAERNFGPLEPRLIVVRL